MRSYRWLYLSFGLAFLALVGWSFLHALRETPTREARVELPGQGWVTLSLDTDPNPPPPSGTVKLSLLATDARGGKVDLGATLPFSYGSTASDTPRGDGVAQPANGGYQAGIQFPSPGDYWLVFEAPSGERIRYQLYVEPAQ